MHYSISNFFIVGIVCLAAIVSCKDSSTDGGNSSANGVWKLNSSEGDMAYISISDTHVEFYDFMGDAYDGGDECYDITIIDILEINGNTYIFEDPENTVETIEIEVTVSGNRLTVKQPFGTGTITITYTTHNGSTSSFTPECSHAIQYSPKNQTLG